MPIIPPTPYHQSLPLAIRSVSLVQSQPVENSVAEFGIALEATFDNPFDPDDIRVDATVTDPNGTKISVPGFLYRAYARSLEDGKEVLRPIGSPEWRVRIRPVTAGSYSIRLAARDRTGSVQAPVVRFRVRPSKDHGAVRVSPRDRHYFEFSDGHPFFPIGANICWGGDRATYSYDDWLPKYAVNGVNYQRLWLGPGDTTFGIEPAGPTGDGKGFGQFSLADAWRIDYVLDLARQKGIYTMLTIDSYNSLRDKDAWPAWEKSALNAAHGGPLQQPSEFWSNPEARRWYRNKLRYLVARFGADNHVLSWEFWNEVDLTRGFDKQAVSDWHRDMGRELRKLDAYHHLTTTSFSDSNGVPVIDNLPELDYVQTHMYTGDLEARSASYNESKGARKTHLVGEIGADWKGPRAEDKQGLQVHQSIWISMATVTAGTGMMWWWDNLIAPLNLYSLYHPVAKFADGIDWPAEAFRPAQIATDPGLDAWAIQGKTKALAWLRLKGRTWENVIEKHQAFPPVSSALVVFKDLAPGPWRIEIWDTWTGQIMKTAINKPNFGTVTVELPEVESDVAIRLLKSR